MPTEDPDDEALAGPVDRYAVVVGINEYPDDSMNLEYAVDDARRVAALLKPHYQKVHLLAGRSGAARPTLKNVRDALTAMVERADTNDVLFVYFCCHGQLVKGAPHLFMADTPRAPGDDRKSDALLVKHGLALSELLKTLRGKPRWCAIFLDACNMGIGIDKECGRSAARAENNNGGFALLSGSARLDVTQDAKNGGAFSEVLIDGLKGAAADPDGGIRFSALARHIQRGVERIRESPLGITKKVTQVPVLRLEVADLQILPATGYVDLKPGLDCQIRAVAFAPGGKRVATGSDDGNVRLWDAATGEQVGIMQHGGMIRGLSFSDDGTLLASAGMDTTLRIWKLPGCAMAPNLPDNPHAFAERVRWAKGRNLIAVLAETIHVLPIDAGGMVGTPRVLGGHGAEVNHVVFTAEGHLVTASNDRTIRTWNLATGACLSVWKLDIPAWSIALSPDGKQAAVATTMIGGEDTPAPDEIRVFDRKTRKEVRRLTGLLLPTTSLAYTPRGDRLVATSLDGIGIVWDPRTGKSVTIVVPIPSGTLYFECLGALSPDGKRLFMGFQDGRGRIVPVPPV